LSEVHIEVTLHTIGNDDDTRTRGVRTMPKNVQDARRVDPISTVYANTFSVNTLAKVRIYPLPCPKMVTE